MKREGSAALPSRHWQAAIILRARQELAALNLPPDADLNDVLEATGSSRSTAYGLASDLPGHLPDRGVGRPPKEAAEPDTERLRVELAVTRRVRDYMAEHPGAVTKRDERQQYSDSFRSFALDLIGPGGMAECLTTAQAAEALGVSVNTTAPASCARLRTIRQRPQAQRPTSRAPLLGRSKRTSSLRHGTCGRGRFPASAMR